MEQENKSKIDRIEEKLDQMIESNGKKQKKFKLPMKAKVSKKKLKEGYVTVEVINENKEVDFKKYPIIDGTIKMGDTFHAVKESDIFLYKGKPFLHQAKTKINPYNPLHGKHETYGQKYIMARMKSDFIKTKRNIGWGMTIFGLVIAGIVIYSLLTGGA